MVDVSMIHPGGHLAEILTDLEVSACEFAHGNRIDTGRLNSIVKDSGANNGG